MSLRKKGTRIMGPADAGKTDADLAEEFEVGDQVKHPKWGIGTILFKSGTGEHAKVVVVFQEEGQKKLLVKKAKLKKVQ